MEAIFYALDGNGDLKDRFVHQFLIVANIILAHTKLLHHVFGVSSMSGI